MTTITVLGLDPSMSNLGMAKGTLNLVTGEFTEVTLKLTSTESDPSKRVRKNSDDLRRAQELYNSLSEQLNGVDLVTVEIPVGSQSSRAQTSYGICIGLLATVKVPMIQVTPTEVKLAGAGTKTASKNDMIQWATELYPDTNWLTSSRNGAMSFVNKNEHLADAIATIHAGVKTNEFQLIRAGLLKGN